MRLVESFTIALALRNGFNKETEKCAINGLGELYIDVIITMLAQGFLEGLMAQR